MNTYSFKTIQTATDSEAAAISAAIQRFQSDTAVAPPVADTGMDPWLKAALVEGVSAKDGFGPGDPGDLF
ncbi:MAG: hypothetical protein WBW62_04770 [Solirubrobacterales bacterium]